MSLDKARLLLIQAERDLEIGCFDKAASAAYMAARMAAEVLLRSLGQRGIPRRDDKLARAVANLGMRPEAEELMRLYEVRKRADYSRYPVDAASASDCVRAAGRLVESFVSRVTRGAGGRPGGGRT